MARPQWDEMIAPPTAVNMSGGDPLSARESGSFVLFTSPSACRQTGAGQLVGGQTRIIGLMLMLRLDMARARYEPLHCDHLDDPAVEGAMRANGDYRDHVAGSPRDGSGPDRAAGSMVVSDDEADVSAM